jgi:broad specificity phosphatase PhoE/aminoglycoside phosphotransferase (APT) family kinase protein
MDIYLVRHGQSIGNTTREIVSGKSDTRGLTLKGKNQIFRSAWELRDKHPTVIYTSPVTRALESAGIIQKVLNKSLHKASFLSEWDHGDIEGKKWSDVVDSLPRAFRKRGKEDYSTPYRNGESLEMVATRVWEGFQGLVKIHNQDETLVLVSHMAIICTILYGIQKGDPRKSGSAFVSYIHSTGLPNSSITHIADFSSQTQRISISRRFKPFAHTEERVGIYAQVHLNKAFMEATYKKTSSVTNEVYILESDETHICKVMYDQEPIRADRLKQLYEYLQNHTTIPSPRLLISDTTYQVFHHPVLIQDYVSGVEQRVSLEKGHDMKTVFAELLSILDQLYAIPVSDVHAFWIPDDWDNNSHQTWKEYMQEEITKTRQALAAFTKIEQYHSNIQTKLYKLNRYINARQRTFVPIHGDLAPNNIILTPQEQSCSFIRLLDFERAQIGDRLWEYAYYYGWLQRESTSAAAAWLYLISPRLEPEEQIVFNLYSILFHAWTARDTITYKGDTSREKLGMQSLCILTEMCR